MRWLVWISSLLKFLRQDILRVLDLISYGQKWADQNNGGT